MNQVMKNTDSRGFNKTPQSVTAFNMEAAHVDHVQRNILEDGETTSTARDPAENGIDLSSVN